MTIAALALLLATASTGPDRLELVLSSMTSTSCPSGSLLVEIRIQNNGDRPVALPGSMFPPAYWIDFVVRDSLGQRLHYAGRHIKLDWNSRDFVLIYPGFFWGTTFDLGRLYAISRPGKYTISATYGRAPGKLIPSLERVRSSTIAVVVP